VTAEELPRDLMTRSAPEIARVLELLVARGEPILSHVARGKLQFVSRLRYLDPAREYIVVDAAADEEANAALVSRIRAIFSTTVAERYFEFVAGDPRMTTHEGAPAIRLQFPDVLVSHSRRAHPRTPVSPPLQCVADAAGDMPFDGEIVDISAGGVGLLYPADISLEPGTLLKGCVVTVPGAKPCTFDLEVRYSQTALLSDHKNTQRSGCRFLEPSAPIVQELIRLYVKDLAAQTS
jgi:c-di-GMP-binding flagellar brake protein YcgR